MTTGQDIKVTIITVCYNSELTIKRTIKSVLNQTYKNIEYIIVDGKSQDNTLHIVKKYEPLFGGRMKIISETDSGIYDAMNKGIRRATGKLIGIINSDDFYENDAVEKIVKHYTNENYLILYGMVRVIEDEKESAIHFFSHDFLRKRMIAHPACFITKAIYSEIQLYDTKYVSAADFDFMLKLYGNNLVKFRPVYEVIANHRPDGISNTVKGNIDALKVRKNHGLIPLSSYWMSVISIRAKNLIICLLWGRNDKKKNY